MFQNPSRYGTDNLNRTLLLHLYILIFHAMFRKKQTYRVVINKYYDIIMYHIKEIKLHFDLKTFANVCCLYL